MVIRTKAFDFISKLKISFRNRGVSSPASPVKLIPRISVIAFAFILLFQTAGWAEKVRYVIDGDTFILQNNQRVRMVGINAPEISHRRYGKKKGDPFGQEAKSYLKKMIEKKDVKLTKGGNDEFDRYGRRLAYVYLPDGTFVNKVMVREGYAEAYRSFPFEYKKEFIRLESQAKAAHKGMWAKKKSLWERIFS